MKKLLMLSILCLLCAGAFATNYYPRNTAALNLGLVANWTDAISGSGGTSPSNFTTNGNVFIVKDNAASYTISTALTISGTGTSLAFTPTSTVTVTVTNTVNAPTITVNTGATVTTSSAFTGSLTLAGTGVLNYNVATYPTMTSFASGSTINFGGTAIAHTIPAATYGIITTSTTGTVTFSNAVTFTTLNIGSTSTTSITNVLTGGTTNINTGAGATTVSGSGRINGTLNMSGATTLNYNVSSGYPSIGTLASGTTFVYGGASLTHTVQAGTYGNLTLSATTSTTNFMTSAATATWTVAGNLSFSSASSSVVNVCNVASGTANATLNVSGTFNIGSTGTFNLNSSSGGTTNVIMAVTGVASFSSTGVLNLNNCSNGTSYARLTLSSAFSMTTAANINVNRATNGTPSAKLAFSSTYAQSIGTVVIGATSATGAADTITVAGTSGITGTASFTVNNGSGGTGNHVFNSTGAVTVSTSGTTTIATGTGSSSVNSFICGSTFTFSTGTFNMCTNTAGSSTNYLTINGSGGTVMTLTSGTFNGGFPSASSGTFADTINVSSATGDVSVGTCTFSLNRPSSTNTSTAAFLIGRNLTYTGAGTISLNSGSSGTATSRLTVGGNVAITTGQLNGITATGGTTTSTANITGTFSLTSSGQMNVNSATGGTPISKFTIGGTLGLTTGTIRVGNTSSAVTGAIDTLAVTGNTTITSGTFQVCANNGISSTNAFIETGTFTQSAGTVSVGANTGGSATNTFNVNSTANPAFTMVTGTFNVCASTTATATLVNTVNIAGGYSHTSTGRVNIANSTITGTYADTFNVSGPATIAAGTFVGGNNFGNPVANFNGSGTSLTLSGTGQMLMILSANCGNVFFNTASDFNISSTGSAAFNFENTSNTTAAGTCTVNGNLSCTSTAGLTVYWGTGSITNNAMYVSGNISFSNAAISTYGSSTASPPLGFVMNGSGTSSSPKTISITSSGTQAMLDFTVNSGNYVKMLTNIALPAAVSPAASFVTVNSGGTFDCSTFVLSGGAGSGTTGLQQNGTLATANTAGINGSVTTTVQTYGSSCNFIYNGTSAQVTGTSMPASFGSLTVSNSAGVTLSQAETLTGNLTFTAGKLTTDVYTLSMPGSATVTGAGSSSYVNGTLSKTISGLSTVNYEVGDNNYAPVQLALTGASAGSITAKSTNGAHPQMASSTFSTAAYVTHYWTLGSSGASLTTIAPKFTYNLSDIVNGSNSGYYGQRYASGAWAGSAYSSSNTSSPYASTLSGVSSSAFTGDYIVGLKIGPTLTAAVGATVDNPFNITFTDDATWRTGVTQIKVGSNVLPGAAYSLGTSGQITLTPSASAYLQTSGTFVIKISSPGYADDSVTQVIAPGADHHLSINTHPGDALYSGGTFSPVPVVSLRDRYNNLTTSTASITASVGSGSWSIGGTTSVAAVAGVSTFTAVTGSASSYVTGATMTFNSGALSPVSSNPFNVPAPSPTLTADPSATVDATFNVTFTDDATWRAAITAIKVGTNTLPGAAYSISSGNIQFTPSASAYLQTSGTLAITVIATTYGADPVSQPVGPGAATHLAVLTEPVAPTTNPGTFVTQPVVRLLDQYNNFATTSSNTIVATATGATWTIGGTTSVATSGGTATYTDLTASAAAYAPNATITFNGTGVTGIVSDTFNVPFPYGTFTYGTGGTFATLAIAIATLNSTSLGGPIILNSFVNGWTETAPVGGYILGSTLLNSSLSATNTITINGYPGGTNTVITAPVGTGANDGIFALAGVDYVTISGINLQESGSNVTATTQMEYGYGIFNLNSSAPMDGCQNDQIKNCTISLDKTNTNHTYAVGAFHTTPTGTASTPTVAADRHCVNKVYTNTISNCQYPVYFAGYNAGSPYTLYDSSNDVGGSAASTGNTATNWGATGSVSGVGAGVYMEYQNNANASYNTLNNASGGSANVNTLYGVYLSGVNATFTANRNTITLTEQSASGSNKFNGIYAESAGSNITANYNTVTMTESSGSNVITNGIYSATSIGNNFTAKNNTINITMSISGGTNDLSGIYSNSTGVCLMQSNSVTMSHSNTANASVTTFYRITGGSGGTQTMNYNSAIGTGLNTSNNLAAYGNTVNASTLKINNNTANLTSIAASGTIAVGIANSGTNTIQEMNNNNFTISASSMNSGTPAGIYNLGGASTSIDANYDTISLTTNNASGTGIYNANTVATAAGTFNYNVITANASASGTAQMVGIYNNGGLMSTQSMNYNAITTNTYSGGGACYGIIATGGNVATANLTYNTITATTATGQVNGIYTTYDGSMFTPSITYNTIDLSMSGASASNIYYIYYNPTVAPATGGTQTISYNNFKSTSGFPSNTGLLYFIANIGNLGSNNNLNYNYNTGTITKTGNGGSFYGIYSRGITLATGTNTITYNSFSNINVGSGNAVTFWGILCGWNTGIPDNISYNTFNNITCGTSPAVMIQASTYGSGSVFSFNKMSNVTAANAGLYGLAISTVGSGGIGTVPGSSTQTSFGGTFQGNRVNDFTNSNASGIIYPYYYFYNTTLATSTFDFYLDSAYNCTVTGATAPGIYGVYQIMSASTYKLFSNVRNCVFHDFTSTNSSASPSINGVYFTWSDTNSIYNNRIYNLGTGSSTGATSQVVGMNLGVTAAASYYNVYNNTLTAFSAPAANNPNSIIGMNLQSTTLYTWNLYHNTIGMGGLGVGTPGTAITSSGTNFGAAGILFPNASSSVLTLKDNIVSMNVNPVGTGISACLQRNVTGTAGVAPSSSLFIPNYNVYYTNSGATSGSTPKNYLYVDVVTGGGGTPKNGYALNGLTPSGANNIVNDSTFNSCPGVSYTTSYKAFIGSGNENLSYTECNLTSTGFAIGAAGPSGESFAYQNGVTITSPSITTDQAGTTRNSPPCRGANEFSGSAPSSGAPPVISYTPILTTSYCIASPPRLSAAITSAAGINTTSGTKPRMYYRGSSDGNIFASANDSSVDGWKWVEASNSSSPFTFQPIYSRLFNAVSAGTTISYFVVAQDNSGSPLVGYNIAGLAVGYCPSTVALGSGAFPIAASPVVSTYTVTALPSFTAGVAPANFYGSADNATLTLSPSNSDLTIQWQMDYVGTSGSTGFNNVSGARTNNYSAPMPGLSSSPALASPGTAGNVSFKALLSCNSSVVFTTSSTSVNDWTPQVLTTTGGSRCSTGAVTLSTTGSTGGTAYWYAAATGGTFLATGNSYSPTISATTTYYVADSFGTYGSQTIGKADILSSGTNGLYIINTGASGDGLFFTVSKELKINSVKIYPQTSGLAFTIAIYDSATSTLIRSYSSTTSVANPSSPTTAQTVPVNFSLPAGSYKIGFSSLAATNYMWMNTFFTSYPFTVVPNTMTITGPQVSNYYEVFYNWSVQASVFSAPRVAATATINPLPTAGSIAATPASVCAGSNTVLSESGTPTPPVFGDTMSSYTWSGPSAYTSSATGTSVGNVTLTPTSGYYSLQVTYPGTGCTSTPVTTYVMVTPATTPTISGTYTACVGATQALSVTPTGGTWTTTNSAVASVDASTGVVTGVHAGSATISYTSPCGLTASQSFTTLATPTSIAGPSTICVTSSYPTYTVTCDGSSSGAWNATPLSVAVIGSSSGTLTSMAVGSAIISYTCTSGCLLTTPLTVNNLGPTAIAGPSSVCVDSSITLTDSTSGGTWSSTNPAVATVDATGVVTGVSNGSVTISYVTGCTPHATQGVTVSGASLVLSNSGPICSNSTLSLTATPSTSLTSFAWAGPNSYSNTSTLTPAISSATTSASGTYTFTATSGGCTTTATMAAVVATTPSVTPTVTPGTICSGGTSTISLASLTPSTFSTYSIPYAPVTFTPTATLTNASAWTSTYDDGYVAAALPSGMNFSFYGTNYSTVYINANGYITFGSGVASGSSTPLTLPTASAPSKLVALFWHDMNVSTGSITYGSTGTIPNRKFIISYNAVPDAADTNSGQIILYEGSNNIDMMVTHTGLSTKTCGVQNGTTLSSLTAPGQNNTSYSVTGSGHQGWRFATPSYTYAWSPSTALSSTTAQNPVSTGLTSTQIYTVSLYDVYSSCASGLTTNATLNVTPVPSVTLAASTLAMCTGASLTLTATPTGGTGTPTYTWSGPGISTTTGSTPTPSVFTPTVASTTTGAYSVTVTYTVSGCTPASHSTASATVATQPIATLSPSGTSLCTGDTLTLTANTSSGGAGTPTYTWSGPGISTTTGSSNVASFVPTASSGIYTSAIAYSGTGCNSVSPTTPTVNTYTRPSITLGATPSVCFGSTSANQSYTSPVGSPTTYDIVWNSAALTAGFTNVTAGTLSGSPISVTVPGAAPAATYTGTLTVTNATCTSYPTAINLTVVAYPTAAITSAVTPCSGHSTNIVFTGTSGAGISYMVDSGSVLTATLTGGSFTLVTPALTSTHNYTLIDVTTSPCTTNVDTVVFITPNSMHWQGSVSSNWNTAGNWTCGFAPTAVDDVTIDTGTTYAPEIGISASGLARSLTLISGAVVTLDSASTLTINGNLVNNGTFQGLGTLSMNDTAAHTITGIGTVSNFNLNNAAGVTISTANRMTLKGTMTLTAGNFATGDSLVLYSNSAGTARIAAIASGASVSGNVKVMQYVAGGYRRFRFMSHPFSNYIALTELNQYFDVTGSGGAAQGFQATASNAPSAFRYDATVGDSRLAYDPGWRPFTSAYTTADSNRFHRYQGIRIMIRGAKGQGLGYVPYTPSAITYALVGTINQGNQAVVMSKGADTNQCYNNVGNPYPSPVDVGTVLYNARTAGNIYGSGYFVWNPYLGLGGQYQHIFFGGSPSPYYLQANGVVQVQAAHNGDTVHFEETNKSANVTTTLMKAERDYTSLMIYDENYHPYDMVYLKFNDISTDGFDRMEDDPKPSGAEFNFYTIGSDNSKLTVDTRPYSESRVVPLGIRTSGSQDMIIKAESIALPSGGQLYLHDKLLKQYVLLQQGTEYRFSITEEAKTQGEERFELTMAPYSMTGKNGLKVTMVPNPATEDVLISFSNSAKDKVRMRILDMSGITVFNQDMGTNPFGSVRVSLNNLASGVYMVEVTSGQQKVVQRLVKE